MIKPLAPGLRFELRDNGAWLVFAPEHGPIGQINLDVLAARNFIAPVTSQAILEWIKQTKTEQEGV